MVLRMFFQATSGILTSTVNASTRIRCSVTSWCSNQALSLPPLKGTRQSYWPTPRLASSAASKSCSRLTLSVSSTAADFGEYSRHGLQVPSASMSEPGTAAGNRHRLHFFMRISRQKVDLPLNHTPFWRE